MRKRGRGGPGRMRLKMRLKMSTRMMVMRRVNMMMTCMQKSVGISSI